MAKKNTRKPTKSTKPRKPGGGRFRSAVVAAEGAPSRRRWTGTGLAARPGIVAAVLEMISRKVGATHAQLVEELAKRFPDRPVKGMAVTAHVQANKHATRKVREEGRTRYFRKAGK